MSVRTLLLVMPPQAGLLSGFASGLISLANYIDANVSDVDTEILDLSEKSAAECTEAIRSFVRRVPSGNLIIGVTTTTASYQSAVRVAHTFRQLRPECHIVLGGHHASADAELVLRTHQGLIDSVIIGEGERSLASLIQSLPNVDSVPGLARLLDGRFVQNPSPRLLEQDELDQIPITFRQTGLMGVPGKFDHVTYVSARGCPLKCAFCSVANNRMRTKSVPCVIRDIRNLVNLGYRRIAIEDNFFAHSAARTRDICGALAKLRQELPHFTWDCQTRVESLARPGTVEHLASAGCDAVYVGVESILEDQLIYLGKTTQPLRYVRLLSDTVVPRLLDSCIDCYLNFQFGLPGESEHERQRLLEFSRTVGKLAVEKGKTITIFPQLHVVYPGTDHFRHGVNEGRFSKEIFESFTRWETDQMPVLAWLGEYFAHGAGGLPEGILKPAPLRRGTYVVDPNAVANISRVLRQLDQIPGIDVFKYGSHLVRLAELTG